MRYGSVCSGIEAATAAWHPLGWTPEFFSEIEPFPCAVLAHHYPHVPNHGDITKFEEWPDATLDVLVGGTPCQSFSVAGLRKGLADPRGNLMLTFGAIARRYRPTWLVWENVPGVLSSNGGRDFGTFLGMLGELGYGFAYRVLDAQFFGLAQRRRRVFVVGCLGDWRRAAAVLFERHSLSGHPAPSREAREGTAGCLAARAGRGFNGQEAYSDQLVTAHTLRGEGFDAGEDGTGRGTPLVPVAFSCKDHGADAGSLAPTLRSMNHDGSHANGGGQVAVAFAHQAGGTQTTLGYDIKAGTAPTLAKCETPALHLHESLYNKGFRHMELSNASAQETHAGTLLRALQQAVGEETFAEWGLGILDSLQQKEILRQALHGIRIRPAPFSRSWVVHCALSRQEDGPGWLLQSLREAGCKRCSSHGWEPSEQLARELGAYLSELSQPGAQAARLVRDLWQATEGAGLLREALSAVQEVGRSAGSQAQSAFGVAAVRRLTVEECEFLQGFPRGYTLIPMRGKPAADGPRYKALGNSMAVPCMAYIGKRIAAVAAINGAEVAA